MRASHCAAWGQLVRARSGASKFRSVGHKGKFGHEFMEFEFKGDGTMRYANNSGYRGSGIIRKKGV